MNRIVLCGLFLASFALATEPHSVPYTDGTWVHQNQVPDLPHLKFEVDSTQRRVSLTFLKGNEIVPPSIEVTFTDPQGNKTQVQLKTVDPTRLPIFYSGSLAKTPSFIGFEIRIPSRKKNSAVIRSHQMNKIEPP